MHRIIRAILYIVFVGFIGIQFATLLDDPEHLAKPDPNCPICLAAKTEVCTTPRISVSFTAEIILYLIDETPFNLGIEDCLLNIPIRAPPVSWFFLQSCFYFSDVKILSLPG